MKAIFEAADALALWLGPSGGAALGLIVGAALGVAHFRSLAYNADLFVRGSAAKAGVLQASRFALLAALMFALARLGALPLLFGALGLLAARRFALSRWGPA